MIPDAICGHDRALLRWALLLAIEVDQGKTRIETRSSGGRWAPRPVVYQSVHDPAKLAAIIAELLRERGIDAGSGEDVAPIRVESCFGRIEFIESPEKLSLILKMDQCRRLALALLDAPSATAQDIERMIGEVAK